METHNDETQKCRGVDKMPKIQMCQFLKKEEVIPDLLKRTLSFGQTFRSVLFYELTIGITPFTICLKKFYPREKHHCKI